MVKYFYSLWAGMVGLIYWVSTQGLTLEEIAIKFGDLDQDTLPLTAFLQKRSSLRKVAPRSKKPVSDSYDLNSHAQRLPMISIQAIILNTATI